MERNPEPGLKPVKYRDRVTVEREKYFILLFIALTWLASYNTVFSIPSGVLGTLCAGS